MRRAIAALLVTASGVVLLARYQTHPPPRLAPRSALRPAATATASPAPGTRVGKGTLLRTPYTTIQVGVELRRGRITDVHTIRLSGSDAHTEAINRRAEPILREEALRAGSADIDVVSGATTTSESWIESLRAAVRAARRG